MITLEYLKQEKTSILKQKEDAIRAVHQADGALLLLEHLIRQFEPKDSMTLDEFAGALGAQSAEIIPLEEDTCDPVLSQ